MDVGVEFSNYRVIEHIGRGGMADVWSARDKRLSRTVAIKTIARDLSQEMDPVKLFEREAQTIAGLEHPHILPIYEFGEFEGQLYIVMRYVSGGSLEDVLEKGPLSLDETMRIARAVGQALEYAHSSKVIHLDLKPSNILLDSYQSPYLADFGLATVLGPEGRAANPGSGTLLYMAPEQLTADQLDLRADIYSFAILIYHMLTGQLPFDGAMPLALKQLQQRENLPDVRLLRPTLPNALNSILRYASELDISIRMNSMRDVIDALEAVIAPTRPVVSLDTRNTPSVLNRPDTLPLDQLISGPLEGLISRPIAPDDTSPKPDSRSLDDLLSGPADRLISRPMERETDSLPAVPKQSLDELLTGKLDDLISRAKQPNAPVGVSRSPSTGTGPTSLGIPGAMLESDRLQARVESNRLTNIDIDVSDLDLSGDLASAIGIYGTMPATPEELARREAEALFRRARRAWQNGQGRFVLGVTDYILIADYYAQADKNELELDEAGIQMLARGALEYEYELDLWWEKLDVSSRRLVALHALRSENATARARTLDRLETLPDADPPQIPRLVAQNLQVETNRAALLSGLRLLGTRAAATQWRNYAYNADIDGFLAARALDRGEPHIAEMAARAIGRIRSIAAVNAILAGQKAGVKGSLRALALIRDEANSLPTSVGNGGRLYAWLANTWRRLSDDPLHAIWRFVYATLGMMFGLGAYVWVALSASAGFGLLITQVWGQVVSIGITIGVFMGIATLLGDELPQRLRGFWKWWLRVPVAAVLGTVSGTLVWGAYNFFILSDPSVNWGVMLYGGIGIGAAFAVMNLFKLPSWASFLVTLAGIYGPLYFTITQFWDAGIVSSAIMYVYTFEQVYTWLLPFSILVALGINFQALFKDGRRLLRRGR